MSDHGSLQGEENRKEIEWTNKQTHSHIMPRSDKGTTSAQYIGSSQEDISGRGITLHSQNKLSYFACDTLEHEQPLHCVTFRSRFPPYRVIPGQAFGSSCKSFCFSYIHYLACGQVILPPFNQHHIWDYVSVFVAKHMASVSPISSDVS